MRVITQLAIANRYRVQDSDFTFEFCVYKSTRLIGTAQWYRNVFICGNLEDLKEDKFSSVFKKARREARKELKLFLVREKKRKRRNRRRKLVRKLLKKLVSVSSRSR